MLKNTNKTQKTGANFDLTTNYFNLIKKYSPISIKSKICISQLLAKILLKQQSLYQIRHCLRGYFQI